MDPEDNDLSWLNEFEHMADENARAFERWLTVADFRVDDDVAAQFLPHRLASPLVPR